MNNELSSRKIRRIIIYSVTGLIFVSGFIGLLYGMQPMILPFILGAFLAYLLKPLVQYRGSKIKKFLRSTAIVASGATFVYWGAQFAKESMPNEAEKLILKVRLQYRLNERYQNWMGLNDEGKGNIIYKLFGKELDPLRVKAATAVSLSADERKEFIRLIDTPADDFKIDDKYYQYYLTNLKNTKIDIEKIKILARETAAIHPSSTPNGTTPNEADGAKLANLMSTLGHWIIFPLAFMFILLDKGHIIHFFMRLIPNRYFELSYNVLDRVDTALGKYIRGTMIECALVGLSLFIGFFICGIPLKIAIIIGFIGGLTNAIPFVGTFIACAIGIVYSLIAEDVSPLLPLINENNLMLAVVGVVMIAHLLDNAIFQPLVVGSAVNIHPLVVVLGVFGGSLMFGFAGLIFAIPSIVIIKVVTETLFRGLKDYRII